MTESIIKSTLSELLFKSAICESVEDQNVIDYLYKEMLLERLLYGEPVTVPELRKLLRKKILNFQFIKLDGEVRDARGTTMMKYIPRADQPKGIRPSSKKVATFFDMRKDAWRSVSQRSKEIVLDKDEKTGKPVIMVKDKPEGADKAVADTGVEKEPVTQEEPRIEQPEITVTPEETPETPSTQEKPVQPALTVDGKPAEVKKVKPIESDEMKQMFHFVNPKTGASQDIEMTPKDAVKELKRMGKGWELRDENEFADNEDRISQEAEDQEDWLKAGDIRNYLNVKGENVPIEIIGEDPDGAFYARRLGGGLFKIPAGRMQNIGSIIHDEKLKTKPTSKDIITKGKDLDKIEADEIK